MSEELEKREGSSMSMTPPMGEETENGQLINASGHVQELPRNFNLLSAAATGITIGNVWPAVGGAIATSLLNGGPPGVLYEFITVSVFYFFVAASLAELASAIPSAGGVYHWATVTGGKRAGRMIGFFAGYWNWLAWVFGTASMSFIFSNTVVQMYALTHPDFTSQPWHVFVTYIIATWMACLFVCFGNRLLPHLNMVGLCLIVVGFFVTIIVVAVMPGLPDRPGHAPSSVVWKEWSDNGLNYPSGFIFVAGMLNGAYAVGAVDAVTHISEEVPYPQVNIPWAIFFQTVIGFLTGFLYLVGILYAINDYGSLFDTGLTPFPLAAIYRQATGSAAGAIGLLCIFLLCIACTMIGTYLDAGRTLWTLGRDRATPFSDKIGSINHTLSTPLWANLFCGVLVTVLGCIYVGSTTAFNAFIGSFVLMTSASYIAAILPNLLSGRNALTYGPFHLKGMSGFIINTVACAYMLVWFVIYCFPFFLPTTASSMNYASLIWGGLTLFVALWWFFGGARTGDYKGPMVISGVVTEAERLGRHGKVVTEKDSVGIHIVTHTHGHTHDGHSGNKTNTTTGQKNV